MLRRDAKSRAPGNVDNAYRNQLQPPNLIIFPFAEETNHVFRDRARGPANGAVGKDRCGGSRWPPASACQNDCPVMAPRFPLALLPQI